MDEAIAKPRIAELVARFQALSGQHRRQMNERQVCQSFIDPLFEALGWNVRDPDEVLLEVNIAHQRADYTFRIGGVTRFIVEAKAPHRDLTNEEFKRQAVTYAYNKGVNWAVLTNFERLMVFSAEEGRQFLNLAAADYESAFDDLWLLSRQAVESGAFDERARHYGALRPSIPVEKSLFDQLRDWRAELFAQIDQYNPGHTTAQIDERIQQFLNRLIFIRTAEDRHLEDYRLRAALNQWRGGGRQGELIDRLRAIFAEFERTYDSDLFPPPVGDPWTAIFVDSVALEKILGGLYSRPGRLAGYDFAAIDADVLGAVYEQYLGHVAVATQESRAAAQARLMGRDTITEDREAKRQRRKAQGIYYTPRWVVDYIVRQTVGRFIEEHTYNEVLNMRILDPACGSGSFLIRAYEELLRYHARIRNKTVAELDWDERLPILTRNIFGVDLDDQAVQIARLNLLLRALARRETLPSLKDNIRQGNSLISGGEAELRPYFGDAWGEKHAFNWEQEFPTIMASGGFDVVIGNPPYIRVHRLGAPEKRYLWKHYSVYRAKSDIYGCFIEKAIDLLKPGGLASYITSNTFVTLESFAPLRRYMLDNCCIVLLSHAPPDVFEQSTVETAVFVVKKERDKDTRLANRVATARWEASSRSVDEEATLIPQQTFEEARLNIFDLSAMESGGSLLARIEKDTRRLSDCVTFFYGLKTGDDAMFLSYVAATPDHKKLLRRSDFSRYLMHFRNEFVWYVPDAMKAHRRTARPGTAQRFEQTKLLVQDIGKGLVATLDDEQYYVKDALLLCRKEGGLDLHFLLALLNSRLLNYSYSIKYRTLSVAKNAILDLPIHRIDPADADDVAMHDRLVGLVERMLDLSKQLSAKGGFRDSEAEDIEREIARTDTAIDALVYDLYGLTEDERRLVEGAVAS